MKQVAETLGVSRSNLAERAKGGTPPRGPYLKAEDAVLPIIRGFVDERPTYGYRRIAALVNRELAKSGGLPVNRKRVYRIMQLHALLLERHTGRRQGRPHDGNVMAMCSNLRWSSDGLEFVCWNHEIVRMAFIIDAFDRVIIAWAAVSGAAGGRGEALRHGAGAACGRAPLRQWQPLHREGDQGLRVGAQPGALLHAGEEPGIERHVGGLRQNLQARLCSCEPFAGRRHSAPADRRMGRRLQSHITTPICLCR
jgi:transposase InsO family protein